MLNSQLRRWSFGLVLVFRARGLPAHVCRVLPLAAGAIWVKDPSDYEDT